MQGLNWREIELWVQTLRPHLEGRFVDKVFVPERPRFARGYLKAEWAFRLISRKEEGYFYFGLRAGHVYFSYLEGKALKPAPRATQPVFGMALNKFLKGAKIERIEAVFQERMIILWFGGEVRIGLVLGLIPASPQGVLIDEHKNILAETRIHTGKTSFEFPAPRPEPSDLSIRHELLNSLSSFNQSLQKNLDEQAFTQRKATALKEIKTKMKEASLRSRQSETALSEALREPDWQAYGDLLKSAMGSGLKNDGKTWRVTDFETGETKELPADPKLEIAAQVERFYQNARRKNRRISEAKLRKERFEEKLAQLARYQSDLADFKKLETIEKLLGLLTSGAPELPAKKRAGGWDGKSFYLKRDYLFG